jgi:hypothetical protein
MTDKPRRRDDGILEATFYVPSPERRDSERRDSERRDSDRRDSDRRDSDRRDSDRRDSDVTSAVANAAFIFGIVSWLACGIIFGPVGAILGLIVLFNNPSHRDRNTAMWGFCLGVTAFVVTAGVAMLIFFAQIVEAQHQHQHHFRF